MAALDIQPQTVRAHELYGDFWFNSNPVPISALRGQVIVIDFWDYTSIHCERGLPYLKEWQRKYTPFGLVLVGVHTPMFPFARDPQKVQRAIERLGITYPVVMDNESLMASRYDSRSWPSLFVIDKNGFIRYRHVGEGDYGATEHVIQTLLYDAGVGEVLPMIMDPVRGSDRPGAVCYRATPELYAGYLRGSLGNVEGFSPESVVDYRDPLIYLDGRIYVAGQWMNGKDSLRLEDTAGGEGQIVLDYQGLEVYAVLNPEGTPSAELTVKQDDTFLDKQTGGADILRAADGRTYLRLDEPRAYGIVRNREYGEHVLRLSTGSRGVSVYSFSFVSAVIPELVSNN